MRVRLPNVGILVPLAFKTWWFYGSNRFDNQGEAIDRSVSIIKFTNLEPQMVLHFWDKETV